VYTMHSRLWHNLLVAVSLLKATCISVSAAAAELMCKTCMYEWTTPHTCRCGCPGPSRRLDFCHAMQCSMQKISAAFYAVIMVSVCPSVHPSVCLSVTFVDSVETNKRSFKLFSPSYSHTILVFQYQTSWQYSDGNP